MIMIIILRKQILKVKMNILTMKITMTRLLSKRKNIKKKNIRRLPAKKQKKNQKGIMDYIKVNCI